MKKDKFFLGLFLSIGFIFLQSTILKRLTIFGVLPDISLIIIVFCSTSFGSTKGEIIGFTSGIIQDFLGIGPLGFNAIIRTLIGYIYGKFKGKFFLDSVLFPILFIVTATVFKEFMTFVVALIFVPQDIMVFFDKVFFIELGMNAVLAPIIFVLLKVSKIYKTNGRENY